MVRLLSLASFGALCIAVSLGLVACQSPEAPDPAAVRATETAPEDSASGAAANAADVPVELRTATSAEILRHVRTSPGEVKVVNMWATWCGPCREEFPDLIAVADSLRSEGVTLTFVSVDDSSMAGAAQRFLGQHGVGAPGGTPTFLKSTTETDEAFAAAFTDEWKGDLPVTLVYDRTGTRRAFLSGRTTRGALAREIARVRGAG